MLDIRFWRLSGGGNADCLSMLFEYVQLERSLTESDGSGSIANCTIVTLLFAVKIRPTRQRERGLIFRFCNLTKPWHGFFIQVKGAIEVTDA